MNKNKTESKS